MEIKIIKSGDIAACPYLILSPEHYREDGTCRCGPETGQTPPSDNAL